MSYAPPPAPNIPCPICGKTARKRSGLLACMCPYPKALLRTSEVDA